MHAVAKLTPCVFAFESDAWRCVACGRVVRAPKRPYAMCKIGGSVQAVRPERVGAALKRMLSWVGINPTPTCSCNARAAELDRLGADWAEANVDVVVGWLREEAASRGLPFLDIAVRLLVRRAISNARQEQARGTENTSSESAGSSV